MTETTGALGNPGDEQLNNEGSPSETQDLTAESAPQSVAEPISTQQAEPISTQQAELISTQQAELISTQQAEPTSTQQAEPTSTQQAELISTQQAEPISTQQAEPTSTQQTEPSSEQQTEPSSTQQTEPSSEQQTEPTSEQETGPSSEQKPERLGAVSIIVETEADVRRKEEERRKRDEERRKRDEVFEILKGFKENDTVFEIEIIERVKGGLRGTYDGLRVFLPTSHFAMKKSPSVDQISNAVGKKLRVKVQELQTDERGYKSVVVSHRDLAADEFWDTLEVGSVHEGVVSSVTSYGAFVNIGEVEGLVHISRLSKSRIDNPSDVVKKGDNIKVTVVEVDKDHHKLGLSHKDHESDPWPDVEQKFPVGSKLKGKVRRLFDFGAYVQVAPRIEGLVRIGDLSWTQRIKHPSEVLAVGQQIDVEVLGVNAAKNQLTLGYKQTQENPWSTISEKLSVGAEKIGIVKQVSSQGAIIRLEDTFDGFMPRSKMVNVGRGRKLSLNPGDKIECVVIDINTEATSVILAMKENEHAETESEQRGGRHGTRPGGHRGSHQSERSAAHSQESTSSGVTLADMLREADKSKLKG